MFSSEQLSSVEFKSHFGSTEEYNVGNESVENPHSLFTETDCEELFCNASGIAEHIGLSRVE